MLRAPGTKLGPNEIRRQSAGGMDEVLPRSWTLGGGPLAVKISPQDVPANADMRQRFERRGRPHQAGISRSSNMTRCLLFLAAASAFAQNQPPRFKAIF